jgi:hypothetical protein
VDIPAYSEPTLATVVENGLAQGSPGFGLKFKGFEIGIGTAITDQGAAFFICFLHIGHYAKPLAGMSQE